jgi:hypothetical protein
MKKQGIWSGILLMLFSMIFMYRCSLGDGGPVDVTAPTIEVHEPGAGAYLEAGSYINFEAIFKDDFELGSYSIDIHDNFDGHSHGRIARTGTDPSLVKWSFKRSYTIPEGMIIFVAQHDDDIEVAANAMAGPYHFIVQAVDKAGNATNYQDGSTVELEVFITNDSQPIVNITNLENGELDIEVDVLFMVEGDVADPTTGEYAGMHSLEVVLGEGHDPVHQHVHMRIAEDGYEDLIDVNFEGAELDQFMIDDAIQLDNVFEAINFTLSQAQLDNLVDEGIDHLVLTIKIHDEQGNINMSNTEVHIHTNK